jgi:hypothetical protein
VHAGGGGALLSSSSARALHPSMPGAPAGRARSAARRGAAPYLHVPCRLGQVQRPPELPTDGSVEEREARRDAGRGDSLTVGCVPVATPQRVQLVQVSGFSACGRGGQGGGGGGAGRRQLGRCGIQGRRRGCPGSRWRRRCARTKGDDVVGDSVAVEVGVQAGAGQVQAAHRAPAVQVDRLNPLLCRRGAAGGSGASVQACGRGTAPVPRPGCNAEPPMTPPPSPFQERTQVGDERVGRLSISSRLLHSTGGRASSSKQTKASGARCQGPGSRCQGAPWLPAARSRAGCWMPAWPSACPLLGAGG